MQVNTHSSWRLVGDTRMPAGSKTKDNLFPPSNNCRLNTSICAHSRSPSSHRAIQGDTGTTYICQVVFQERNPKPQETDSLMIGNEHIVLLPQRATLPLFYGSVNKLLFSRALCYTNITGKKRLLKCLEHRETVPMLIGHPEM